MSIPMREKKHLKDRSTAKGRGFALLLGTILVITGLCGGAGSATETGPQPADGVTDPRVILDQEESATSTQDPAVSENLTSATLVLTRPPESDRIPYTGRGFSSPVQASIAWWKSPGFMENTSEFRRFQRSSDEERAGYDEDKQIFFTFIQDSLDSAENQSFTSSDIILFRGISSSFADTILDNAEYRETSYASTSYDPVVSLDLFGPPDPEGYHSLLVMERRAGEQVLFINEDEREYLIPRGSVWRVVQSVVIQNLTVAADFSLYNRTTMRDSFEDVRLIYVTPITGEEE